MPTLSPEEAQARVRAKFGNVVAVKPVQPEKELPEGSDAAVVELITRVCYFYPQYPLEPAQELTNSQVTALLLQAEKQRAIEFYNQTLIAASPHSKKGKMVDTLIKQYKKIAEL